MRDLQGQMLMPWGSSGDGVEASAVEAVTADLPQHARTVTPKRAAEHLCCCEKTVHNMIDQGELLVVKVGAHLHGQRQHRRVVVKIDRPFDPQRYTLLSLEEAKKLRSNIGG